MSTAVEHGLIGPKTICNNIDVRFEHFVKRVSS